MDKDNSREIQFKEELVRKAKNGDTKAFSLLYAGVCKEMYKFALYIDEAYRRCRRRGK